MSDLILARPGLSSRAESHWSTAPPLGLGYLAAAARRRGINVQVIDGKLEKHTTGDQTIAAIQKHDPAVVGLSAMTVDYPAAADIARTLKEHNGTVVTVLGGAHANALPSETLSETKAFDFLLAGEAEAALCDLVEAVKAGNEPAEIEGLHVRNNGTVHCAVQPSYNEDITQLPFPAWDLFPRCKNYPVMWQRGCPFNCVFCSRNMSKKVRSRPVEHIFEEIRWLKKDFNPESINFQDETFGLNPEKAIELLDLLAQENRDGNIAFTAQTRVDMISKPVLERMRKAGFHCLELGVESGDPDVLDQSGKEIRLEQVEKAVKMAREVGVRVWLKFILGLPGETRKSIRNTINFASKINPDQMSVAVIVAYPGSQIYTWAKTGQHGYHLLTDKWEKFDKYLSNSLELEGLPHQTLRRLQIQMYLETYVRNFRIKNLAEIVWNNRGLAVSMLRNACLKAKT